MNRFVCKFKSCMNTTKCVCAFLYAQTTCTLHVISWQRILNQYNMCWPETFLLPDITTAMMPYDFMSGWAAYFGLSLPTLLIVKCSFSPTYKLTLYNTSTAFTLYSGIQRPTSLLRQYSKCCQMHCVDG